VKTEPESILETTFRRSATWLKKTGTGYAGKKAKRLIHRRDRHESRHQLRNLNLA
jgi:hypothetical protein